MSHAWYWYYAVVIHTTFICRAALSVIISQCLCNCCAEICTSSLYTSRVRLGLISPSNNSRYSSFHVVKWRGLSDKCLHRSMIQWIMLKRVLKCYFLILMTLFCDVLFVQASLADIMGDKTEKKRLAKWYFGGLGSAGAACCTHPLDLLKVHLQTQQDGNIGIVRQTGLIVR